MKNRILFFSMLCITVNPFVAWFGMIKKSKIVDNNVIRSRDGDRDAICDFILARQSFHNFSAEPISHDELMTLFQAASWAPSSYNEQPWSFIYAYHNTPDGEKFFNFFYPNNQQWAKNGSVFIVVLSKKTLARSGKENGYHAFDTGAACQNLALQAAHMGLVTRLVGGFDREKVKRAFALSSEYSIDAMMVVGRLTKNSQKECKESSRKALNSFVFQGAMQ